MPDALPRLDEMGLTAIVLDLDGVVTDTASVHAAAWKALFDGVLQARADAAGTSFQPFDLDRDYIAYVDGKPRYDGVRSFLESRGIHLPEGTPDDPPDAETVCGLGNRKNNLFVEVIRRDGPTVFPASVALIRHMREQGLKTAVVSSSKNCGLVLESAGLTDLFDTMVDGNYAAETGLRGKPHPDTFVRGCELIGVVPGDAAAFEDATVGVQACRAGGFRLVVGVDRGVGRQALLDGGADVVVNDLGEFDLG
jgi:beta-phosphoglucomutase family hydrolase